MKPMNMRRTTGTSDCCGSQLPVMQRGQLVQKANLMRMFAWIRLVCMSWCQVDDILQMKQHFRLKAGDETVADDSNLLLLVTFAGSGDRWSWRWTGVPPWGVEDGKRIEGALCLLWFVPWELVSVSDSIGQWRTEGVVPRVSILGPIFQTERLAFSILSAFSLCFQEAFPHIYNRLMDHCRLGWTQKRCRHAFLLLKALISWTSLCTINPWILLSFLIYYDNQATFALWMCDSFTFFALRTV